MITWQPHLPPWLIAAVLLAGAAGLAWLLRRLRERHGRLGWWLWAPKAALLLLVVVAVLDPSVPEAATGARQTLWLVVDRSGSMQRRDAPGGTRQVRAEAIARRFVHAAENAGARAELRWCDEGLREHGDDQPLAPGTDLAAALRALAGPAGGDAAGVVLLSDGGDEPGLANADGLPAAPIAAVAVGGDPERTDSVGIAAVNAPESAEPQSTVELQIEVGARGSAGFRSGLAAVPIELAGLQADGSWKALAAATLDLRQGRARADLALPTGAPGLLRLRAAVKPPPGDQDRLDDQRPVQIQVRERRIRTLYLTRSPGVEVKHLRDALARDPGIAFAAVYRTVGERWGVQGGDADAARELTGGLPKDLTRWDAVILGAFPASELVVEEQRRLAAWVQAGGGLGLLGGDQGLGAGGWGGSALAPCAPWSLDGAEPAPGRGAFAVTATTAAASHPAGRGLAEALAGGGTIASLNRCGSLRPGATALLVARADGGDLPLVAAQGWGSGRVLGVASDSWWRLPRDAAGLLWRQGVRWLAGVAEGSGALRVAWDRGRYRPGDAARVSVRVAAPEGARPAIAAALTAPDGSRRPTVPEAQSDGSFAFTLPLPARGTWKLHLAATAGGKELGAYDRVVEVEPLLPEGARPGRDDAGLAALARAHGGAFAGEEDTAAVDAWIAERCRPPGSSAARSLVFAGWWWFAAVLITLVGEWWLRRRRGVI